jgi:AcrR family transcriptional regulator
MSVNVRREKKSARLPAAERRAQLLDVGRKVFAKRGFEAASIEEIAELAKVSRPIVYAHFGDKSGLFAVVVDREMEHVTARVTEAIAEEGGARERLQRVLLAFLSYVEERPDGFAVLSRETPARAGMEGITGLLGDLAGRVAAVMRPFLKENGYDERAAPIYANALIGMATFTGLWWQQQGLRPSLQAVTRHLSALAWAGIGHLPRRPELAAESAAPARRS